MSEKENVIEKYGIKSIPQLLKTPLNRTECLLPTGFRKLDEMLGGGFKPGLNFVTGFAASGKSTFVSQIALQMSAKGIPVLYFSSEMADRECVCRMLTFVSHSTFKLDKYTANDFLNVSDFDSWEESRKAELQSIIDETSKQAQNIYLVSVPTISLSAEAIREVVGEFISLRKLFITDTTSLSGKSESKLVSVSQPVNKKEIQKI
jgi:KaiC/GvpD/RAD55 family RecA-like ATPase